MARCSWAVVRRPFQGHRVGLTITLGPCLNYALR